MTEPSHTLSDFAFQNEAPRLIFAIATQQQTANLALLLEFVRPNSADRFVWVLSEQARSGGWSDGPGDVMARHGRKALEPVTFPDRSDVMFEALEQAVSKRIEEFRKYAHVGLIMTGGTKVMSAQLDEVLRQAFPDRPILAAYNEVMSPMATVWPEGWAHGKTGRLSKSITLDDILECNGYRRGKGKPGTKLWPNGTLPNADRGQDRYAGISSREPDWGFINEVHQAASEAKLPKSNTIWPGWADLTTGQRTRFEAHLTNNLKFQLPAKGGRGIFLTARNLVVDWYDQQRRNHQSRPVDATPSGPAFELLVAKRVKAWLDAHGSRYSICEAWSGVEIIKANWKKGDGQQDETEIDIGIVTTNGTLFNLECKADTADGLNKDIARKRQREDDYASIGSRMGVSFPVLSDFAATGWMGRVMAARESMDKRIPCIDLTRENQPIEFESEGPSLRYWVDKDGKVTSGEPGGKVAAGGPDVLPFERSLESWLSHFRH